MIVKFISILTCYIVFLFSFSEISYANYIINTGTPNISQNNAGRVEVFYNDWIGAPLFVTEDTIITDIEFYFEVARGTFYIEIANNLFWGASGWVKHNVIYSSIFFTDSYGPSGWKGVHELNWRLEGIDTSVMYASYWIILRPYDIYSSYGLLPKDPPYGPVTYEIRHWQDGISYWAYGSSWDGVGFRVAGYSAPVPEPSTILLFAAGLAGLTAIGRRKRN